MNKITMLAALVLLPAIVNATTMIESGQPNSVNSPEKTSNTSPAEEQSEISATCYVVSEYYNGTRRQKVVSNQIESSIMEHVKGKNLNLNDMDKGGELTGLEIEIDGHSVDLNVYRDLSGESNIAIVGDAENRLVFRLGLLLERSTNHEYKLDSVTLSLERGMSKIDGMTHALAFMDGEINETTNTTTDDEQCRRELAKNQAKNQYWGAYIGPGLDSPNILEPLSPGICKRTVSMRTCYESNGQTLCAETVYSFPERCD
ncbi:hypothetical protein [Alteromonas macleodii]|uniref:Secreted protein n=1 Tax=Alteromonas macleodii TaxID=28108 RepID=A0A6T9Y1T1_ALTMA|nr:hypothetical protein [Alteromonas macleodii]CAB9494119.1 conserved exported protein of unknown function [Alteromonas macleodii]